MPENPNPATAGEPLRHKTRLPRACTSRSADLRPTTMSTTSTSSPSSDDDDDDDNNNSNNNKNNIKNKKNNNNNNNKNNKNNAHRPPPKSSRIVTPLVASPIPSHLPLFHLRSMWEFSSLLHFFNIFRAFLNIGIEFTAEELESALITPNAILDNIHIPLLRAIPPVTRMALGRATWVTVLCRKLRDWWHWVAEGDIPIVASHGAEVELYKTLDPGTRVRILKALCDIRVEQEDIRSYIDVSIKRHVPLSAFRKERIGGDGHGISFWYEDDPVIGHRLYREIRKIETKKVKARGGPFLPVVSCQWETVATNLDEFLDVSEKLISSKNRIEAALGKRLKIDVLPEVEKLHKRKEKLLKKQQREALLLDSYLNADGLSSGRSLRDRKPVTYTFDDYDRSINEAIKLTKRRQASPESTVRRENAVKAEAASNGRWNGSSHAPRHLSNDMLSPKSTDYDETDGEHKSENFDRNNRRRQRPQRYSERDFVEAISDNEADFDSDDDIVGEAVYDDEYLRNRKQRKVESSSSEGDEEYRWEEENAEDDDEEEDDSLSTSEDTEEPRTSKKIPTRSRRGMKVRSVHEIQSGLRRSKRTTRNRINYRQYEMSESDGDSGKASKSNLLDGGSDVSNNVQDSEGSQDMQDDEDAQDIKDHQPVNNNYVEMADEDPGQMEKAANSLNQEAEVGRERRYLDLNELAPGTGFDDGPNTPVEGEDTN